MKFLISKSVSVIAPLFSILAIGFAGSAAQAQTISWTDWTSSITGTSGSATGTMNINGTTVGVTYTGEIAFAQTNGGTNYWNPSTPYISATVPNAPGSSDIIALSQTSTKTLTFTQPLVNPVFAVVSLNANGYRFNNNFNILSYGTGYWGSGTLTKTDLGNGAYQLDGTGEGHGVIELQGTVSSISWSSANAEYWNGFTVGARSVATVVPETNTFALALPALGMVGTVLVRRRKKA